MLNSNVYTLLAVLAGSASAQHVTTATILAPDWCVTQATPSVTVLGQSRGLTTYSYLCPNNGVTRTHSRTQAYESRASDRSQRYESRASERSQRYESRASARSQWHETRSHLAETTDVPCVPNPYTPYDDCAWQDGVPNDKREAKPKPVPDVPCIPNPYTPYDDCAWQDGVPNDKDLPSRTRSSRYTRSTRTSRPYAIQTVDDVPCVPNPYTPYDDCEWQDGVPNDKRSVEPLGKREDGECHGWHAQNDCVPWQIIQGEDVWAVHYSVEGVIRVDQQCTFGPGGVASGPALCTGDGRLDPSVWGYANGPRTRTFAPSDVNKYFARNTAVVTAGGNNSAAATSRIHVNGAAPSVSGQSAAPQQTPGGVAAEQVASTGAAAHFALPTGVIAMAAGAGGILAAAIAL